MPRQPRDDQAGQIYRAPNRGNQRQTTFHKEQDFQAFERILAEGLAKYPVELFAYTLMPNHWHLVLRPAKDRQMGRLLRWVTGTHTLRYRTWKLRGNLGSEHFAGVRSDNLSYRRLGILVAGSVSVLGG